MQRGGGRTGRPFGPLTIEDLETAVRSNAGDGTELRSILGELAFRKSARAQQLKSLVQEKLRAREGASSAQD